jgi:hypothetical protein
MSHNDEYAYLLIQSRSQLYYIFMNTQDENVLYKMIAHYQYPLEYEAHVAHAVVMARQRRFFWAVSGVEAMT